MKVCVTLYFVHQFRLISNLRFLSKITNTASESNKFMNATYYWSYSIKKQNLKLANRFWSGMPTITQLMQHIVHELFDFLKLVFWYPEDDKSRLLRHRRFLLLITVRSQSIDPVYWSWPLKCCIWKWRSKEIHWRLLVNDGTTRKFPTFRSDSLQG